MRPQVMRTISTLGKWRIVETDAPQSECYRYVEWTIVHANGGSVFAGCYAINEADPSDRTGDREIRFSPDGTSVEVVRQNGTIKHIAL